MAGMAGGAGLLHLVEDGVLVAVDEYARDPLDVSALLSFLPEFLPAPAVIVCISGGPGEFQRLSVRVGEHQNLTRPSFLHDDRYQSVLELYLHIVSHSCDCLHDYKEDISHEQRSQESRRDRYDEWNAVGYPDLSGLPVEGKFPPVIFGV